MFPRKVTQSLLQGQNVASKCGGRHKCGGASEMIFMWRQAMRRQNVPSDTHVAAGGNVASNNAASKCGVKHKCGGASEMIEMWRQTMRRQNVPSDTNVAAPPQ